MSPRSARRNRPTRPTEFLYLKEHPAERQRQPFPFHYGSRM